MVMKKLNIHRRLNTFLVQIYLCSAGIYEPSSDINELYDNRNPGCGHPWPPKKEKPFL